MGVSGRDLLQVNAVVGRQWLKLVVDAMHWYAALLDPRPDLGVPARKVKVPYIWWWIKGARVRCKHRMRAGGEEGDRAPVGPSVPFTDAAA